MPLEKEEERSAPLFVKIEKYREILASLDQIKSFVSGIKQLFTVLAELESTREDALKILRATVVRLEKAAAEIDSELLRPVGLEPFPTGEIELRHLESTMSDLQRQVAGLREELEKLGSEG